MNKYWMAGASLLLWSAPALALEPPAAPGAQAAAPEIVDIGRPERTSRPSADPALEGANLSELRAELRRDLRELRSERHEHFEAHRERPDHERRTVREESRDERRDRQRAR